MKKTLISLILALALLLSLCVPAFAETETPETSEDIAEVLLNELSGLYEKAAAAFSPDIKSKDMTFYLCKASDTRTLPVYFMGDSDVPYLSLADWAELYTYLLKTYVNNGQDIGFELDFSMEGDTGTLTRKDGDPYPMVVDCAADTITFFDYDAFIRPEADRVLIDVLESDDPHSEDDAALFRRTADCYERYGDEVVLDAGVYGIDLVSDGEAVYVPAQTLSDILLAIKYMNLFYNGEALFFVEYGGLEDEETGMAKLLYAVEKKERSEAMGAFSFAELCLAFDNLYGLKDAHGIASFADLADQCGAREALSGRDVNAADAALYTIIEKHLSDRHSHFNAASPFSREGLKDELSEKVGMGFVYRVASSQMRKHMLARMATYPDGVPSYEEVGNTAYITFDEFSFVPDGVDYYKTAPTAEAEDTVGIIIYAYSRIMREDSPIENVVLDLSCNGGGDADAAVFVLSAFLGEGYASLKNTLSGALASGVYEIDLNLDGKFDENDKGLTGKKLFCLTSACSFSCGNLVPCVFKNSNDVTLIGRASAGGSCVVLPMSTAYGTAFQISGPHRLAFTKNGSFYDIDQGAAPDIPLMFAESFYDREALTEIINGIR